MLEKAEDNKSNAILDTIFGQALVNQGIMSQ
jgi:hypothetical protein